MYLILLPTYLISSIFLNVSDYQILWRRIYVTKSILDNCIAQELFRSFKRVQDKAEEHSVILNAIFERGIKEKKEREKESLMKSIDLFTFSINSSIGYLINIYLFDIGWN